jgi:hypothetical protein
MLLSEINAPHKSGRRIIVQGQQNPFARGNTPVDNGGNGYEL